MPKKSNKSRFDEEGQRFADPPSTSSSIDNSRRRHSMGEPRLTMAKAKVDKLRRSKAKNTPAELKGLQDSLSHFFTPSDMRRSRAASFKISLDQPLEISIDHHSALPPTSSKPISSNVSSKSSKTEACSSSSHISPKSPHRRDQLQDALTKYYTPNPNKRRLHKEGEYWQMSRGESAKTPNDDASSSIKGETIEDQGDEDHVENDTLDESRASSSKHSRAGEMPKSERMTISSNKSIAAAHAPKKQILKRKENAAAIKKAQLIKRAYKGTRNPRKKMTQPVSSSSIKFSSNPPTAIKNTITNYFRPLKPPKIAATRVESEGNIHSQEISEESRAIFEEARKVVQKDLDATNNALRQNPNAIFPPKIQIHCYEICTWYSSPYPQEYACLPVLHICDACLMYLSVPSSHFRKCKLQYPPGNEIYRGDGFSIFEVDGNQARVYCRNLCLLAKLFIDHKTLYFDVEPFLFYVLTLNDESGCHFVGYFSKEKYSNQKYNLACIMTLPCYQGRGFGRFLIDFSYLLSRREELIGSPERPLSDLGRVAYQSYWLSAIFEYFYRRRQAEKVHFGKITLTEISRATSIAPSDIAETLAENLMLQTKDSKTTLVLDEAAIKAHWERAKSNGKRIWLDENKLQWAPKIYSPTKEFRMSSPTFTPLPSITTPVKAVQDLEEEEKPKGSTNKKKVNKSESANRSRRKLQLSGEDESVEQKTPKISTGKIGRKKAPEKKTKEQRQQESQSSGNEHPNDEEETKKSPKISRGKGSRKQRANCKDGMEKGRKKRTTSTEDDDDDGGGGGRNQSRRLSRHLAQSLSLNSAGPSTSNSSANKQPLRKSSLQQKCTISRSRERAKFINSDSEEDSSAASTNEHEGNEMEVDSPKEGNEKQIGNGARKFTKRVEDSDESGTDVSSLSSANELEDSKKRIKILKKRRMLKKSIGPSANSSSSSSSSSNSSNATNSDRGSVQSTKEEEQMLKNKKRRKSLQHRAQSSMDEEDEEEDRSLCSSASPQPNGDRLPIFKSSTKELDNLLVNMGGEPDTINMGGEPGDDEDAVLEDSNEGASNSFSTGGAASGYKTPPQMIQLVNRAEAEDEIGEEQPSPIEQKMQMQHSSTIISMHSTNVEMASKANAMNIVHQQHQMQTSLMGGSKITLKLPALQIDHRQLKSCSPADIVTVEMPALDAAERHSPVESQTHFGDEPAEEDDEAPPMLSPQAENMNSSTENVATPAAVRPIGKEEDISGVGSSTNDDSFKMNESRERIEMMAGEQMQQQNTSTSSAELLHLSPERKKSHEPPIKQQQINIGSQRAKNEMPIQIPPLASAVHPDYQNVVQQQQTIPQIRVRSESNAEFSAQPLVNKLQRTSSFSGHANNTNEQQTAHQQAATVQTNLSTLSLPTIHGQHVPPKQPLDVHLKQYGPQIGSSTDTSTFIVPPYNQYNAPLQRAQQQQQIPPPSKSVEKTKERSGKKGTPAKEKTGAAKPSAKAQKAGTSTKQQQPHHQSAAAVASIQQQTGCSPPFASPSSASANAIHSQWMAQFAHQYYQQQYPSYQQQFGAVASQQQQMYGPYANAIYNQAQAAAWQWQMQQAAKFQQQNPAAAAAATAAAYQNLPHEFSSQWMSMVNGVAAGGSTGAGGTTLTPTSAPPIPTNAAWPSAAGFNQNAAHHQLRHPSSASQSQHFYHPSPHHHPPM